jgi:hypothetical protein
MPAARLLFKRSQCWVPAAVLLRRLRTGYLPARIGIERRHALGELGRARSEILLEDLTLVTYDECHYARIAVIRRIGHERKAADFDVPSPATAGRSPSGSRMARRSLRVETLISFRFMAQRLLFRAVCADHLSCGYNEFLRR